MIAHLHDREKALESFGWRGREAEWIALVCLHSGVFTRAQFCYFFDAVSDRKRAFRFVRDLVNRGLAVEDALPHKPGRAKVCRISNKEIYRKLGIENVRHRQEANDSLMLRRLLSLDYVLENPQLPWLPTEREKVAFFDARGIDRRRLPQRLYHGAAGNQTRYFALKLPIAANARTATFAYVDAGRYTDTELRSWGAAALKTWNSRAGEQSSQREYGPSRNDPDVKAEIQHIEAAVLTADTRIIAQYSGVGAISDRLIELKDLPKSSGPGKRSPRR